MWRLPVFSGSTSFNHTIMLKVSIVQTISLYHATTALRVAHGPCLLGASRCRTFVTSHARSTTLAGKRVQGEAAKDASTLQRESDSHLRFELWSDDRSAEQAVPQALTKQDGVSTVPTMVRGDWVLFHPVYTAEELKSVEVSSKYLYICIRIIYMLDYRFCIEKPRHLVTS